MEILYISSVPSPKEFDRIKEKFKSGFIYGMNESGFKFHTLIQQGMCSNSDVHITSVVGRSVDFRTHKGILWNKNNERVNEQLHFEHIGFISLPIIKHIMIGFGFFFKTLKWLIKTRKENRAILMDAAYVTVHPFVMAAKTFSKCHTSAIFCDIYEYMAEVKDARNNDTTSFFRRIVRKIAGASYRKLDSFVLLTEQMNTVVNTLNKPYIVMEGLVDINMQKMPNSLEQKEKNKTIMYAGALREQYGLKNLVEGFRAYKNDDARLWIFGAGDYSLEIEKAVNEDKRIFFGGMLPLPEVIEKELKVSLLVNSRPANMEFAKYSFPSKNMEYMVSGTPILTTRLPGMPQEYYDYIFTIDGNTPQDVTVALEKVFSFSPEQLHSKGERARDFVLKNKNNIVQSGRILKLVGHKEINNQ